MGDSTKLGKIFIGGLSYETTDDKLRQYFGAYGAVTDAVVMKDPISRRSRGFGFITYADPSCVDRALAQPTHILDGRRVEAKRAVPRAESLRDIGSGLSTASNSSSRSVGSLAGINSINGSTGGATKKIFVGGLHYETKDADFRKYFAQFGKVVSAEVMFNRETNKSRGFGFVVFESETSVEVVLQEKIHVIDSKSVEVKRAVPRTDVPPPRSVSSRAGSFGGPGPGSVGSLDDLNSSTATTPPVSLSGSVPSTSSLANHPLESSSCSITSTPSKTRSSAANRMANGTLVGYAAAVRYGSRGVPKPMSSSSPAGIPSSVGSPSPPSRNGTESSSLRLDSSTMDGVADALSSLVLGDSGKSRSMNGGAGSIASPLHSASSSSLGSLSDKLPVSGAASNGGLSPLDVALSPLSDPVMEQWKLSPASTARESTDLTSLSASEASYLSHGLLDDDVSASNGSQLSWQAPSWQQPWHSPPLHHRPPTASDGTQQPPLPPAPQSLYSMFSSGSSSGPSWHNGYGDHHNGHAAHVNGNGAPSSDGFGGGMMGMGMGLPVDGGYGGAFGMHEDEETNGAAAYSSLGGLLGQDYLSSSSSHHKHGGAFGSVPEAEDDHRTLYDKNDHDLAYDLPASAAEYHRQFR